MIIVLGNVAVRQGQLAQALTLSQAHVARSRVEPGCLAHAVHRDTEDACRLVFVEQWSDRDALLAHFKLPASRDFVEALAGLAVEPPRLRLYAAEEIRLQA